MSYTLRVRPEAEEDLAEARRWYEGRRAGLGDEFLESAEEVLNRLERMPEIHAVVYKGVRKAVLRRFPYVAYYRIVEEEVEVLAVVHGRRDPSHWQSRV